MFGNQITSGLSFGKIISGLSKTLNIANQVIPIYKQAKPLINNLGNITKILKSDDTNKTISTSKEIVKETNNKVNLPTFFQ
jgi:hypothetical protein